MIMAMSGSTLSEKCPGINRDKDPINVDINIFDVFGLIKKKKKQNVRLFNSFLYFDSKISNENDLSPHIYTYIKYIFFNSY